MLILRALFLLYLYSISCTIADYDNYQQKWLEFKKTYNKQYSTLAEEKRSFLTFIRNHKRIFKHNRLYSLGQETYKLKANEFADLTHAEFLAKYVNDRMLHHESDSFGCPVDQLRAISLPPLVDWRRNGSVTEVQNQGASCRSSYTFATTGVLEAQYHRQMGKLIKFSEQNLLDCTGGAYNNSGCSGGSVSESLKFVLDNNGIDTEQSYPYQGIDNNGKCRSNAVQTNFTIKSINRITPGLEWLLQTAIATVGPVAVHVDASLPSFQFYSSGIYHDFACNKTNGNHYALAIGYGTENKLGYYIVKNSFGTSWGENGFIRMARFQNNNCGIATNAIYPLL